MLGSQIHWFSQLCFILVMVASWLGRIYPYQWFGWCKYWAYIEFHAFLTWEKGHDQNHLWSSLFYLIRSSMIYRFVHRYLTEGLVRPSIKLPILTDSQRFEARSVCWRKECWALAEQTLNLWVQAQQVHGFWGKRWSMTRNIEWL